MIQRAVTDSRLSMISWCFVVFWTQQLILCLLARLLFEVYFKSIEISSQFINGSIYKHYVLDQLHSCFCKRSSLWDIFKSDVFPLITIIFWPHWASFKSSLQARCIGRGGQGIKGFAIDTWVCLDCGDYLKDKHLHYYYCKYFPWKGIIPKLEKPACQYHASL